MKFVIPGEPQGKARARTVQNNGFTSTYTPKQTVNYENLIKLEYQQQSNGLFFENPIAVTITAYYGIPVSASKKKRELMLAGAILPTRKPDWDNIGKIVCDALNGIAYKDDAIIADGRVIKRYAIIPKVDVEIRDLKVQR